jgi:translation initiation factor IF-2
VPPKRRAYELAKEFNIPNKDFVALLKDGGFPVNTHMTAFDEFEEIRILAWLEAQGYGQKATAVEEPADELSAFRKPKKKRPAESSPEPAADEQVGGLSQFRKTKKKKVDEPAEPAPAPEAAEAPEVGQVDEQTAPEVASSEELVSSDALADATAEPDFSEAAERADAEDAAHGEVAANDVAVGDVTARDVAAAEAPAQPSSEIAGAASATDEPGVDEAVEAHAADAEATEPSPKVEKSAQPAAEAEAQTAASAATDDAATAEAPAAALAAQEQDQGAAEAPAPAAESAAGTPADGGAPRADAPKPEAASMKPDSPVAKSAAGEAAEAGKTDDPKEGVVRPSDKRRGPKKIGFIDLSKVQAARPVRRESRRLGRSDDSAVSSVQPTFGGRRRGTTGGPRPGAENRGDLTASQLREREAGRFLRRQRPGGGGSGGGGRRGGRGGHRDSGSQLLGSPYRGQGVKVEEPISIKKLAEALAVKQNQLLSRAFDLLGFGAVNINSILEEDTAILLAEEFDVTLEVTQEVAAEEALLEELAEKRAAIEDEDLVTRAPTVAVLGHVDHGKTTLIDSIRRSQITEGESGGITQHIGAYQVTTEAGNVLTVVDTPGHAAFTSMRARGAQAVDIVILVVAADDGVMPQTEEAINHAKAAGVPIVVALNKIDKPEANPDKVLNELAAKELIPEEWGGQTAIMRVSALKNDGIDDLLERVFLESEVLELKAHPDGPAAGVVLEAEIQQGRGIVAHLLVQDGSLERGNVILAGEGYGKVRSITNDRGVLLKEAGPSMPIEVTGLDKLPGIGERFHVVPDLASAKEVAEERERSLRLKSLADRRAVSKENLFAAVAEAAKTTINVIVKADVQGSVEVIKSQLAELTHDEVQVRVLHSGVGQVSESDVDLAITSEAYVVAFHVGVSGKARQNAERESITIKNYSVIYELLDDLRAMMEGSLSPDINEEITGHVEVRRIFRSSKFGNIAGSHVTDGTVSRDSKLRLLRDGNVVFTGQIGSLRRESDEAKEVREGFDCGIVIKNFNDIQEGDIIEAFKLVEVKRTL